MKRQDVIGVDVDGVLVNFAGEYLRLLGELHGVHRSEANITSFSFDQCVSTPEQDRSIWQHIQATPGLVYALPVYEGAMDFLAALRQKGRVVACTSPANPLWTAERAQWLVDKAGFAKRDVIIASDKALCAFDYLVDDHLKNTAEWQAGAGMGGFALLFDRPWNHNGTAGAEYWQRVLDYEHCLEAVEELQND